jgi:hypothetical protein
MGQLTKITPAMRRRSDLDAERYFSDVLDELDELVALLIMTRWPSRPHTCDRDTLELRTGCAFGDYDENRCLRAAQHLVEFRRSASLDGAASQSVPLRRFQPNTFIP